MFLGTLEEKFKTYICVGQKHKEFDGHFLVNFVRNINFKKK